MQNSLKVNNFYVQYKEKKDGAFEDISGSAVFPFTWGELLDERLDEAYLTILNGEVEFGKYVFGGDEKRNLDFYILPE